MFVLCSLIAMSSKDGSTTGATVPPVPILSDSHHSGISKRLSEAANASKARVYANKTESGVTSRKGELPVLPPGIDRDRFNAAIENLKRTLGSENVVINDKPLDDGWYLEHPCVSHDRQGRAASLTVCCLTIETLMTLSTSLTLKIRSPLP
jgi:hypothetical protein